MHFSRLERRTLTLSFILAVDVVVGSGSNVVGVIIVAGIWIKKLLNEMKEKRKEEWRGGKGKKWNDRF